MGYIQLAIALLSVSSQVLRWLNNSEEQKINNKQKKEKLLKFKKALENGDFKEIENMSAMLRASKLPQDTD